MKLIINADDFGLTPKVNEAIVQCMKFGLVRSTTIMMNQPGTEDAIARYHRGEVSEIGLHLTFTAGKPICFPSDVPDLVDEDGYFLSRSALTQKPAIDEEQVMKELNAQFQMAQDHGIKINHLDSHHFATLYPNLKPTFIEFANQVGLPCRRADVIDGGQETLNVKTPDAFDINFFDKGATLESLQRLLKKQQLQHPKGVVEFMCHPGLEGDEVLESLSGYNAKRQEETNILTSSALKQWLIEQHIEVIGFEHL